MKTIAIINLKGGVGKTTTAVNMAALLAGKHGKRVLLIDNDPQGNASQFFDCYEGGEDTCGTAEILRKEQPERRESCGIEIINANISLLEADNALRASAERQDNRIKEYLQDIRGLWDYCIIDNPPALLMCTINALCAADEVIIPVTLDNWAMDGVETVTEQIRELQALNSGLKIAGVLLTNYRKTPENEMAEKWLREHCRCRVFRTKIRRSDKVTASTYYKEPLEKYSPRSAAAVTYRKFVKEYLQESGAENGI
ncbi:MAG: ParA family protein [Muribaculaceae bacterium]|nr:ParA family protein [Muribaculaceae bacterium]